MKNNSPPQRSQITLFHVLWLIFVAMCSRFAGRKLVVYWGNAGWVVGVLVGIACGFLLIYVLWLLSSFYYRFRPLRPTCRQGKCHPEDYEIRPVLNDGFLESENRCKCGDTYVRRGNRFLFRRPDGSMQPYMVRKPFQDWEPDK